jgi:hypothetical protein
MSLVLTVTSHRSNNIDLTSTIMLPLRVVVWKKICVNVRMVSHMSRMSLQECSNDFIVPYLCAYLTFLHLEQHTDWRRDYQDGDLLVRVGFPADGGALSPLCSGARSVLATLWICKTRTYSCRRERWL